MCDNIERIIKSLGFPPAYLKALEENGVDDEFLASNLDPDTDLFRVLADVIPPVARRHTFIKAVRMQFSNGTPRQTPTKEVYDIRPPSFSSSNDYPGNGPVYQPAPTSWNDKAIHVAPNVSTNTGRGSIQILKFEKVQGGGNPTRKTIMLETEFRELIAKCTPGAPVAVLAIAGKANKGKSLFLSYVLRYLKALQNGPAGDWMGWNDREVRSLDEGFRWANGYEVVTKGIWTWSEPISIKNSEGQIFDVLLLDTQGVFDEETGQREWNILAGLSLLTSSIMILNTSNDVQEDTLESLQNFLSFGLLALDRDNSTEGASRPFQNLVFLVRDWENHQQYPFGNQGGRRFIQRKLQEKPEHDEFHRRLRRQMRECFESIDCFLFPFPGRATRESNFTGSVVNASADYQDFALYVQQCIEQLLNPNHFPLKTLNGNVLTAPDLFEMFKSYVDIFNSDKLPSSSDLYNAAADRCNAMIISRCVAALVQHLETTLSSVPFLDEQEFVKAQKAAEMEAVALFKKSRKMGDNQAIIAAQSELKSKLDDRISFFAVMNQNKLADAQTSLEEEVTKILRVSEAELESKVGDDVLSPEAFNDIYNQVVSNARQKFQDLQNHPSLKSESLARLENQMKNVDRWLQRVKMNKEMGEQAFLTLADASAIEYWNALSSFDFKDLEELERAEAEARSKAFKALESFPRKLDSNLIQKVKTDLTAQLDVMHSKMVGQLKNNLSLEGDQAKAQVATEDAVRQYRTWMEAQVSSASTSTKGHEEGLALTDTPLSADWLANIHGQCESTALNYLSEFLEKNCENVKNAPLLAEQSKAQLLLRLSQEFSNFKRLNDQKSKTLKVHVSKCLSEAQQQFNQELQQLAETAAETASFTSSANDLKIRVKAKLQKILDASVLDETDLTKHLFDMDSDMGNLIALSVKVVESKRKENEAAARAKMQTEDLKGRMESMQKQFGEQQEKLSEATRGQEEAKGLKQQLERMKEEFEEREKQLLEKAKAQPEAEDSKMAMERMRAEFAEREKILLETAKAQAEAEDLKKRLERMEREREAQAARPDLLDMLSPFVPLLGLLKKPESQAISTPFTGPPPPAGASGCTADWVTHLPQPHIPRGVPTHAPAQRKEEFWPSFTPEKVACPGPRTGREKAAWSVETPSSPHPPSPYQEEGLPYPYPPPPYNG